MKPQVKSQSGVFGYEWLACSPVTVAGTPRGCPPSSDGSARGLGPGVAPAWPPPPRAGAQDPQHRRRALQTGRSGQPNARAQVASLMNLRVLLAYVAFCLLLS